MKGNMKGLFIIVLFVLQGTMLFAQQGKRDIKKGNDLYKEQKYTEAEASYRKSVEKKHPGITADFNLGDALYKQKKYTEAAEQFSKIASSPNQDKTAAAHAYHNLGNSLVSAKKLEEGINAYKKALVNNPGDDETRYNLAYAQEMLKKQQQQKNKDKQKDQNKDQKDKDKKDKENQEKDKKDKDKQEQDKNKQDPGKKDQDGKQQPDPGKLSKEEAQRMLDALNNNEKQTQDKLKNKKFKGQKARVAKDW